MEIRLDDHTAIVTGAGRGIGEEIAMTFAEAGADLAVAARTEAEIEAVAERAREEHGVETVAVPTDLADADDIEALVETTREELATPTVLVNNAGANLVGPPLEHTPEEIDTMLDVNVRGLFLLSQEFALAFREADLETGRIVNVSSLVAELGVSIMSLYGGTKAGVNGVTRGLAAELAPEITVNAVSPGLTRIARTEAVMDNDELFDFDRIPLQRVGVPEDTADACVFLASDFADYITGEELLVDGGVRFTAGLYK